MATLTNKQIRNTYKDLLKINSVSDNTGIDGTLRAVEDGDATASALQISTGGVKSTGTFEVTGASTLTGAATFSSTLAVTGNATFDTDTLFVDAANNEVGIGTTSPADKLDIVGGVRISSAAFSVPSGGVGIEMSYRTGSDAAFITVYSRASSAYKPLTFGASAFSFDQGNVGIGTTSPLANASLTANNGIVVEFQNSALTHANGIALKSGYGVGYLTFKNSSGGNIDAHLTASNYY